MKRLAIGLIAVSLALPLHATGKHPEPKPPATVPDSHHSDTGGRLVAAAVGFGIGWLVAKRRAKRNAPPPALLVCPKPEPLVCEECEARVERAERECGK